MSDAGDDQRLPKRAKYIQDQDSTQSQPSKTFTHEDYTVGWICPLQVELIAALEMLDEEHEKLPQPSTDHNVYHLGSIAGHNVVITGMWQAGNIISATVVTQTRMAFPNVRFGLLVGIGGGVPVVTEDGMIRLGNVVVSKPAGFYSGAIQYDRGKAEAGTFVRTGALAPPPPVLLLAAQALGAQRARSREDPLLENIRRIDTSLPGLRRYRFPGIEKDYLFPAEYKHIRPGASCEAGQCDPAQRIGRDEDGMDGMDQWITVHRGTIASGELVLRDGMKRDILGQEYGVLCFEMEAAGALSDFPCLVIRGISDYCDSHKNDQWHGFAAAAAAAYARQLFFHMPIDKANRLVSADNPGIKRMIGRSDDRERQKIAAWISLTNYATYQADSLSERQEGTGQWLLDTTEFCEWVEKMGVLYCPGIPGAGKTILSSIVINHLQESFDMKQDIGIAYIFCNYRQQHEQTLVGILASILKQLVQKLCFLPEDLNTYYRRDQSRLQQDQLLKLLVTVANSYSRVYLVIDALDECSDLDRTRDTVISHILDLQKKCNVAFFATSRFIPEIATKFEPFPSVEIRATVSDVMLYAEGHIHELPNCVRRSPELSKLVVSQIVSSVNGMFLLAKLYLDSLKGKSSPKVIKTALSRLESGSNAYNYAYEKAMERIEYQIADQANLAKRLLSWLACAQRSLTLTEIQHALAVEIDESFFDEENLPDIEDMISACAGLVTYNEQSHVIALVHYTTQEYFEREWTSWFPDAHCNIGRICLTYLCYDAFASGSCETTEEFRERLREYPLYTYAATNWGYHVKIQHPGPPETVFRLLRNDQKITACFQAQELDLFDSFWHFNGRQKPPTGLHLAVEIGLEPEVEALLKINHPLDVTDSKERTPLSVAIHEGNETIVRILLHHGANPHFQDNIWNSLSTAARFGHGSLIDIFLELGCDPNATDGNGCTPLSYAAERGNLAVARLLLDRGAQPDISRKDGRTPLSFAAEMGHREVVKLLLELEVDLDAPDTHGRTHLSYAAQKGHLDIVGLLFDAGAKIDRMDEWGTGCYTPLIWAALASQRAVMSFLLEKGANPNITVYGRKFPLATAVENNDVEMIELLFKYGADPYLPKELFQRAARKGNQGVLRVLVRHDVQLHPNTQKYLLPWAAKHGYTSFIEVLLEEGADINIGDPQSGGTPLSYAVMQGHDKTVALLIEKGANPGSRDKYGQTPLFHALERGKEVVLQVLLGKDPALLNCRDGFGRSPLLLAIENRPDAINKIIGDIQGISGSLSREMEIVLRTICAPGYDLPQDKGGVLFLWAAANGHLAVIDFLLEKRISYLCQDHLGRTPFILAAKNYHWDVIKALLDKDPSPNLQDKEGFSPLSWAFEAGEEAIIQLLFENGADPNEPIKETQNSPLDWRHYPEVPLLLAVRRGYERIVKFLLEIGADPNHFISERDHKFLPPAGQEFLQVKNGSPLSLAADKGYTGIVEALLDSDANAFVCHIGLREAMKFGNSSIVSLIMQKGIRNNWLITEHGQSLLFHAAFTGYSDVVRSLLDEGMDPNTRSMQPLLPLPVRDRARAFLREETAREIDTPLCFAAQAGHEAVAQVLLSKNADVNIGSPLLHAIRNGHTAMAELLLQYGTHLNVQDDDPSLLLEAVGKGYYGMVKSLLEKGVLPEPKDSEQEWDSPLFEAILGKHTDIVELLLENGANPNVTNQYGRSVLFLAAEKGWPNLIELLLQYGTRANSADRFGQTALFRAVLFRRYNVVRTLLEKGNADPQTMTCAGRSPLSVAHDFQYPELICLLSGKKNEVACPDEIVMKSRIDHNRIICDTCECIIPKIDLFFQCSICRSIGDDSLQICIECASWRSGCYDKLHTLEKMGFINGRLTTIGKFPRWRQATLPVIPSANRLLETHST